jgi:N-acyl-D-aspartate/D-glutamate deacylase
MFPLGDPPDYEPAADRSIAAEAARRGVPAVEYVYDLLLEKDGKTVLYAPAANYADGNIEAALEMARHANTILGLGDGGAHCGLICDASFTTHMLSHWARGHHGGALPLPLVVRGLTAETARAVGLADRGLIAKGYRADINIIDFDRLALHMPEIVYDLPSGGGRLHQRADGYVATIVNGQVTYREGVATGNLPGRLVRGAQTAPAG